MLSITLSVPTFRKGYVLMGSNAALLKKHVPDQPQVVEWGAEPVTVSVRADGSTMSFSSFAGRVEKDRDGFAHAGSAIIPMTEVREGTVPLNISHRGFQAFGVEMVIHNVSWTGSPLNMISAPQLPDMETYYNSVYPMKMGASSAIADALRFWVWCPAETAQPLPGPAFLSRYNTVPYSTEYLISLITIAAARHGYTYSEVQTVMQEGGDEARRLLSTIVTVFPNSMLYMSDFYVDSNDKNISIESFDCSKKRKTMDCEDAGRTSSLIFDAIVNNAELGYVYEFARKYTVLVIFGAVTQPSAGTGVKGGENPKNYGGHCYPILVRTSKFKEGNMDDIIFCEGTGVATALLDISQKERAELLAANRLLEMIPGLDKLGRKISLEDPYHVSSFYRDVVEFCYRENPEDDWVQHAVMINPETGERGVTFKAMIEGDFTFIKSEADTAVVREATYAVMATLVAEPAPQVPSILPAAIPRVESGSVVNFFQPDGVPFSPPGEIEGVIQLPPQREELDTWLKGTRWSFHIP